MTTTAIVRTTKDQRAVSATTTAIEERAVSYLPLGGDGKCFDWGPYYCEVSQWEDLYVCDGRGKWQLSAQCGRTPDGHQGW
jgi:hypothetical protein